MDTAKYIRIGKTEYQCTKCKKEFASKASVEYHINAKKQCVFNPTELKPEITDIAIGRPRKDGAPPVKKTAIKAPVVEFKEDTLDANSAGPSSAAIVQHPKPASKIPFIEIPEALPMKSVKISKLDYLTNVAIQTLNDSGARITHIAHISDIHIRLHSREQEYREVFEKLYDGLNELKARHPNTLIVCTGDVLHDKQELHAVGAHLVWELFKNLCSILPVVVIPGNHDGFVKNKDTPDALSAILKDRHSNIHYLLPSGAYRYNNIVFGVSSLFDHKFVKAENIIGFKDTDTKVALYHGAVGMSTRTNLGHILHKYVGTTEFDGYDFTLLGDIHKHQYLNPEQTMAYPGSLIAQNFGELDDDHGWLEWDIHNKTSTYHRVPNDYAFKSITLHDKHVRMQGMDESIELSTENIDALVQLIPPKAQLRIVYNALEADVLANVTKLKQLLNTKLPHASIVLAGDVVAPAMDNNNANMQGNISMIDNLRSYIAERYSALMANEITAMMDLLTKSMTDTTALQELPDWEPLLLKFENLYGYGSNNVIDFTKFASPGIVGAFGPNSIGKSTLLDIITFAFFGKGTRKNTNNIDIINRYNAMGMVELVYRVGGNIFKISRSIIKKGDTTKNPTLAIHKYHPTESTEPNRNDYVYQGIVYKPVDVSSGKQGELTNPENEFYIGTIEDFLFTVMFLQGGNDSTFRNMTQSVRKDFLCGMFKLNVFDAAHKTFKQEVNSIQGSIKTIQDKLNNQTDKASELQDVENIIAQHTKDITDKKQKLADVEDKLLKARLSLHHVNLTSDDATRLLAEVDVDKHITRLNEINHNLALTSDKLTECEAKLSTLALIPHEDEINKRHEQFANDQKKALADVRDKITNTRAMLKPLYNIKYDPKHHEQLLKHMDALNAELTKGNKQAPNGLKFSKACDACTHNQQVLGCDAQVAAAKAKLEDALKTCEHNKKLWMEDCTSIESNKQIQTELNDLSVQERTITTRVNEEHNQLLAEQKQHAMLTKMQLDLTQKQYILAADKVNTTAALDKATRMKKEYEQVLADILHNAKVNANIAQLEHSVCDIKEDIDVLHKELLHLYDYKGKIEYAAEEQVRLRDELTINEAKYRTYERLRDITSRDGFAMHMLRKYIPHVGQGVNAIIAPYTNVRIDLMFDGKDIDLVSYPRDDVEGRGVNIFGGMESFMVDMAFKLVIGRMALIPKTGIMFIDEGISVLDSHHIANIGELFGFLRLHYSRVMLISHIDSVRDEVDDQLVLQKVGKYSKVNNTT